MDKRTLAIVLFVISYLWGSSAAGTDQETRPEILGVSLYISNGMLTSDINSTGLFSERIVGTVQSGLPAVVELFYSLVARDHRSVKNGVFLYELCYDVWEDFYSFEGTDTTCLFPTFETLSQAVQHLRNIALIPLHEITMEKHYAVRVGIVINPLQGTDRRKITGWLNENVRGESGDSWREQVLNLNDLIQHFFSKRKDGTNRSEWFQTDFFMPGSLPVRENKGE